MYFLLAVPHCHLQSCKTKAKGRLGCVDRFGINPVQKIRGDFVHRKGETPSFKFAGFMMTCRRWKTKSTSTRKRTERVNGVWSVNPYPFRVKYQIVIFFLVIASCNHDWPSINYTVLLHADHLFMWMMAMYISFLLWLFKILIASWFALQSSKSVLFYVSSPGGKP